MRELGLDFDAARSWFAVKHESPFLLIEVDEETTKSWATHLGVPLRRCYITDGRLAERVRESGQNSQDVIATVLPDPGSTMSGDFGEIITAIVHGTRAFPVLPLDPKKWQLKNDRRKPAPYSDVVQMILPSWPTSSSEDQLICAEVKSKATASASRPIQSAVTDSKKDQDGRLDKTLIWLKERAILGEIEGAWRDYLNRFIQAVDFPRATREFRAVAVISEEFVAEEMADLELPPSNECTLIVISIHNLKDVYESVFLAASTSA